jgi:hypothetical protein
MGISIRGYRVSGKQFLFFYGVVITKQSGGELRQTFTHWLSIDFLDEWLWIYSSI